MKWLGVALLMVACGGSRTSPERLGDEAWHRSEWSLATAHYRNAPSSARVLAKRADASLLSGRLIQSARLFEELSTADPTRAGEAAAGLVRVAEAAERNGDQAALATALVGLRRVAPTWPLGRLALRLSPDSSWDAVTAATLAPAGIAGGGATDKWLLVLGRAWQRTARCTDAIAAFETIRRRDRGPVADTALTLRGTCALSLGLDAMARGESGPAERWLNVAGESDVNGAIARRALVALGDLRMARGDLLAAFLTWQRVVTAPVPPDSITVLALDRLRASQTPGTEPDTSVVPGPL